VGLTLGVTIGYAIIAARQAIPDMPQTLPPTVATVAVVAAVGSTLAAGTYAVEVTQRNAYGETIADGETTALVVGANEGIQITSPLQPGATTLRAYLTLPGGNSGTEQQYIESAVSPFTISTPPPNTGVPPQKNRAWLPDTDGNFISAAAIFGWANDGLKIISRNAGGLTDYCGVQSVINQPLYNIPGEWNIITDVWYDGYWMMGGERSNFFRRNTITSSILSSATVSAHNNQMLMEVYPQPARTSATTALSAVMSATDTVANVASAGGFVLPFGFLQVDTGVNAEFCAYATINGNQFTGLIRGLGGSGAIAHASSAPVYELNLFWNGKRQIFTSYGPGQSATILPIPNGWDVLLSKYMVARAKDVELDGQYAENQEKYIAQQIQSWARQNKGVVRRRQVGPPSQPGIYFPDQAGGLIVN
jgi:hypothetical protein